MDAITQTVPVGEHGEKPCSRTQIPTSFTSEWQTSDPSSDGPAKRQTLTLRIKPYMWCVDTGVLLFVAGLFARAIQK
ncbi:hypothetical protein SAMD00023353_5500200 [Rosellinia necatrix]|uniref:Uncharacterized protein n=1 Tax=Rosellinia necatrix TaxID=77044 RepID=A0A1S8A9Z8_ROSNE|nr:hypothetical protein SAMD00023353_5500200 [Rosellinia necatrix]